MTIGNRFAVRALKAAVAASIAASAANVQADDALQAAWEQRYSGLGTTSGDAECLLCHGTTTNDLNAYGADICLELGTDAQRIASVETLDSDLDPTGSDNLAEITASAQPGWTDGVNGIYSRSTCGFLATISAVPDAVPQPYDPIADGVPIADAGGPYEGLVGQPITFDGTGSSDDGSIVAYDWDFGDGATGTGAVTEYAYADAGTYTVTLTVEDDAGNSSQDETVATVLEAAALNLDIAQFRVSKNARVDARKGITIKLVIENTGSVNGNGTATVTGTQNGSEVFSQTLEVFDTVGNGRTTFEFGPYAPEQTGDIEWTAEVIDGDPDIDTATEITTVR